MAQTDTDILSLFLIERSGVRGALVHLDETWQAIQARAPYPAAVAERLGETCAAREPGGASAFAPGSPSRKEEAPLRGLRAHGGEGGIRTHGTL